MLGVVPFLDERGADGVCCVHYKGEGKVWFGQDRGGGEKLLQSVEILFAGVVPGKLCRLFQELDHWYGFVRQLREETRDGG